MFCLKVTFLTERSVAARPEDGDAKGDPEWPPHPGRLFCALVAAWGETGRSPAGKLALEELEKLGAPQVIFPDHSTRNRVQLYVPANDVELPNLDTAARRRKGIVGVLTEDDDNDLARYLPETRLRNDRFMPSASLVHPSVWFVWQEATLSEQTRKALEPILRCTSYLGHSSSLVAVETCDSPEFDELPPGYKQFVPDDARGTERLRVPAEGRMKYLEDQFAKFQNDPRKVYRPAPGLSVKYRPIQTGAAHKPAPPQGVFRNLLALRRFDGDRLGLRSTYQLSMALRGALLTLADKLGSVPEFITGHSPESTPEKPVRSEKPHLGFVPLANVGFDYADGSLLGIGILCPELAPEEESIVFKLLGKIPPLSMGAAGVWKVETFGADEKRKALQAEQWMRPSTLWASVTPFVFDRFPKNHHGEEAQEIVRRACVNVGLPKPKEVACVQTQYALRGVPNAAAFAPAPARPGKPRRWHIHLLLTFEEAIRGPLSIGAGRHYGYGFCAPIGG